jgi:hypothetical protein
MPNILQSKQEFWYCCKAKSLIREFDVGEEVCSYPGIAFLLETQ